MRRKSNGAMKETLLTKTVELVDLHGGALPVNLREVARQSSCSAQNIYNYYSSLNELLSDAIRQITDEFYQYISNGLETMSGQERIETVIYRFIKYSFDYPGRFNFYFLEKHDSEVFVSLYGYNDFFGEKMYVAADYEVSKDSLDQPRFKAFVMIKNYLVGRITPYVTNKKTVDSKELLIKEIAEECEHMLVSLLDL